eukprot:CAMPEP_0195604020 /NCGR_PEP_ID=MMETSP0815-20121206/6428_1 /TAXON_ID=97485 /ORGANISM="Prymnesium parvum, Strain Texoma1" /LENGTH=69 /DNA_ID=CAMNT_0040743665 /DNA_START=646 /DNA_END=852 /DNA_ORIENTATION=-
MHMIRPRLEPIRRLRRDLCEASAAAVDEVEQHHRLLVAACDEVFLQRALLQREQRTAHEARQIAACAAR